MDLAYEVSYQTSTTQTNRNNFDIFMSFKEEKDNNGEGN